MIRRVSNLETALVLAEEMKASGVANWFRGQTRNWPLLSSFVRMNETKQKEAMERYAHFHSWVLSLPALAEIARDEDAILAVAQHYQLATNLLDFSTEPKVAAFFASHPTPPEEDGEDTSCIICLNCDELVEMCESIKIAQPDMAGPKAITIQVPGLLRIQAQRGVFLEYPFDSGFERHVFDFDRIVFPTERDPTVLTRLIPKEDIYPTQKSDLEILLDQFFMIERLAEGNKATQRMVETGKMAIHHVAAIPDGIEADCFGPAGLPLHDSWNPSRLQEWLQPPNEDWRPASEAPNISIKYRKEGDHAARIQTFGQQILEALAANQALRTGPVKWALHGHDLSQSDAARIVRVMELIWDGLRPWPYDSSEIAQALATAIEYGMLIAHERAARLDARLAKILAERCIGDAFETDIGLEDNSYTRGYANTELLRQAVRDDFFSFLTNQWRPKIKNIRNIFQIASNPQRALVFDRLKSVFCTQIVPTQAVLRDERTSSARLYNPARAISLGLP